MALWGLGWVCAQAPEWEWWGPVWASQARALGPQGLGSGWLVQGSARQGLVWASAQALGLASQDQGWV